MQTWGSAPINVFTLKVRQTEHNLGLNSFILISNFKIADILLCNKTLKFNKITTTCPNPTQLDCKCSCVTPKAAALTTFPRHLCGPSPSPHTSAVRSRCAVGILHGTSYLNRSREAHGRKVSPQEWASFRRTFFFYVSHLRSSRRPGVGYKDQQRQIWDFSAKFSRSLDLVALQLKIKLKRGVLLVCVPEKMCSTTRLRTFAEFAVFLLLVLRVQRGSGANTRTCPPPCACFGELVDCSRLKRGQIPDTIPEWTVQLWVHLKSLCELNYCHVSSI